MMNLLKTEWDSYAEHVVPAAASTVQMEETKQAFYTGAAALFILITHRMPRKNDQEAEDMIGDLNNELIAYAKERVMDRKS